MRKIFALPFGLIGVVLLLVTIWIFSLRGFAFDPGFYTTNLKDQGLFQAIQNDPMSYFNWSGSLSQLNALPLDTQRRIFDEAVPPVLFEGTIRLSQAPNPEELGFLKGTAALVDALGARKAVGRGRLTKGIRIDAGGGV